jgi:hypothetical protein
MTPRMSVRAAARDEFRKIIQSEAKGPQTAPHPDLMAQVRALYEDSAVPVREIAARAGVTERTIYKYARKHGWQPRYLWQDDHPCMLVRGWQAADRFAPAKGAGGRFIRREDAGKPFARGLKANDPAARAKAAQSCAEADRIARAAWQNAERARLVEEQWKCVRAMNRAADEVVRFREEHPPQRRDKELEGLLLQGLEYATEAVRDARLAVAQIEAEMAKSREA